jgi:hypothetical protein
MNRNYLLEAGDDLAESEEPGVRAETGKPISRQAGSPPARGRMRAMPRFLSSSATRALVASLGQVQ